jgi:hypothetical protein
MKRFDFSQSVQLLANIGVIAGIIFLGYELRQNNNQLMAQSRYNYYQNRMAESILPIQYPDFANIELQSWVDFTLGEKRQFGGHLDFVLTSWEYEVGEFLAGRLSEEELNPRAKGAYFRARLESQYIGEITADMWRSYSTTAPSWFVTYMENSIISQSE